MATKVLAVIKKNHVAFSIFELLDNDICSFYTFLSHRNKYDTLICKYNTLGNATIYICLNII
jgi:hypothetical protein